MKKMIAIVMVIVIISQVPVFGEESHELNIDSKSCVLMESSTGMILYENNQNEKPESLPYFWHKHLLLPHP